jgi:thymidylate synthase
MIIHIYENHYEQIKEQIKKKNLIHFQKYLLKIKNQ